MLRLRLLAVFILLVSFGAVAASSPARADCEFTPDGTVCDDPVPPDPSDPFPPPRCNPLDPLFPLNPVCVPQTLPGLPGPMVDTEVSDHPCPPACIGPFMVALNGGGLVGADRLAYNLVRSIGQYETNRGGEVINPRPRLSELNTVAGVRASIATYEQATSPYIITALIDDPALRGNTDPGEPLRLEPIALQDLQRANRLMVDVETLVNRVYKAFETNPVTSGAPVEQFIVNNGTLITRTRLTNDEVRTMFRSAELRALVFAAADRIEGGRSTIEQELRALPANKRLGLPDSSLRGYLRKKAFWGEHRAGWQRLAVNRSPDNFGARLEAFGLPNDPLALANSVVARRVLRVLKGAGCTNEDQLCQALNEQEVVLRVAQMNNRKDLKYGQGVLKIYCKFYRDGCPPAGRVTGASSRNGRGVSFTANNGKCVEIPGASRTSGTPVRVAPCTRAPEQTWKFNTDGTLRALEKCLHGLGSDAASAIQSLQCTGTDAQFWQVILTSKQVKNRASGRCLEAGDSQLQLKTCTDSPAQKFSIPVQRGPAEQFRNVGGHCVESVNGAVDNFTPIRLAECDTNFLHHEWAFYDDDTLRVLDKCMDVGGTSAGIRSPVQLNDCTGGANQAWRPGPIGQLVHPATNLCLDTFDGSTDFGAELQLWPCTGGSGQTFLLPSVPTTPEGLFGGNGGTCVDVADADASLGAIQLFSCNGTEQQQWAIHTDGTIRSLAGCLTPTGEGTLSGNTVGLLPCDSDLTQRWTLTPSGTVVNFGSQLCLDARGADTANGTRLQIFDCHGGPNQRWTLPRP